MRPFRCLLAILLLPAPALAAVHVDGRMAPGEWEGARHVTDFRLTQPLSREPAPYPTEAWLLATPEGLAVAFRNLQPPEVTRNMGCEWFLKRTEIVRFYSPASNPAIQRALGPGRRAVAKGRHRGDMLRHGGDFRNHPEWARINVPSAANVSCRCPRRSKPASPPSTATVCFPWPRSSRASA
jgi:hypothetical protein